MALQPQDPEQRGISAFTILGEEKKKEKSLRVTYGTQGELGSDLKGRSWGWGWQQGPSPQGDHAEMQVAPHAQSV